MAETLSRFRLMRRPLHLLIVAASELLLLGCAPKFAPPVRIDHAGAPGRQQRGAIGIGAVVGITPVSQSDAPDTEIGGTLLAAYGITEEFAIQTGYQLTPAAWHMGFLGVRYTPLPPNLNEPVPDILLDFELGQGIGVGGVRHEENSDTDEIDEVGNPFNRVAGGAYCGFGVGIGFRIVDIFVRGRAQIVKAADVEMTVWVSGIGGLQFNLPYGFRLYSAVGGGFYYNGEEQGSLSFPIGGLIVEGGIAYHFRVMPQR
jgi:hypothetical protein